MKKKPKPEKPAKPLPPKVKPASARAAMSLERVEELAGRGLSKNDIAICLGISRSSYMAFQRENLEFHDAFDRGKAKAIAAIAGKLMAIAGAGSLGAVCFYLKCQAGWKETDDLNVNLKGDVVFIPAFGRNDKQKTEGIEP